MKNIMIACKPENLQCKAFKNTLLPYTEDNNYSINWTFAAQDKITDLINSNNYDLILLSPEVLIYKAKLTTILDNKNIPYLEIKGSDYGLKRMDRFFESIKSFI